MIATRQGEDQGLRISLSHLNLQGFSILLLRTVLLLALLQDSNIQFSTVRAYSIVPVSVSPFRTSRHYLGCHIKHCRNRLFMDRLEIDENEEDVIRSDGSAKEIENEIRQNLPEKKKDTAVEVNPLGDFFGNEVVGDLMEDIRFPTTGSIMSEDVDVLAAWRDSASASVNNFLDAFYQEEENGEKEQNDKVLVPNADDDVENMEHPNLEWDVYICQSRQCKERGASATLDTFQSLSPPNIRVYPAIFSKSKAKGPNVRCIPRRPATATQIQVDTLPSAFEVNNVNGIDKVYRILTHHMNLPPEDVSSHARDCLKDTYEGNAQLEQNDYTAAIASYTRALKTNYQPQEGTVLLLRATAYLQRAFQHQKLLRETVSDLSKTVPDPLVLGKVYQVAQANPGLAQSLLDTVLANSKAQASQFRQMKYRHGLYEYALLHAAQDSLRSTHLLPYNAKAYLRAGDALAELRKLKEAIRYYEKAVQLDPALEGRLVPVMDRLRKSCEFLDRAKELGWSGDTLRLALDVAG